MKRRIKSKHNIVILCGFFTLISFFSHMSEYNEYVSHFDTIRYKNLNLKQLYQELNKALNSNNVQSIWELSKVITRVHFKESGV